MEDFIVSARKYRPSTFLSVVGQQALVTTLKNAITSNHLAHAYLFCGPRGVGKTTCARIFAKTINCQNRTAEGEACNVCESCVAFNEQRSYNIHELDAASNNSVEDIRLLIEKVRIPPQIGKYSVFIIDEVHMLSQAAFNAFLKTLEEPPAHALFILATTEKHKIIPTILSRCQIYDFNRIGVADTVAHLQFVASQEGITAEPEALGVIAQKSDGGMRDALSIFDQVVSFCGSTVSYADVIANLNVLDYDYYFRVIDAAQAGNAPEAMMIFNEILTKGFDGGHFVSGIAAHLRDVLVCRDPQTLPLLEVGASIGEKYQRQAAVCSEDFLYPALKITNQTDLDYRISKNKRLLVEIMLIRLCQLSDKKKNELTADEDILSVLQPVFDAVEEKAVAVQPAISPQPAVRQTPPSASRPAMPRISINNIAKPEEAVASAVAGTGKRNEVFDEATLQRHWRTFAVQLPKEEIHLLNTMQKSLPKLSAATVFEVTVHNPYQEKILNEIRSRLMPFLAECLRNDFVEMNIVVDEVQEEERVMLPKDIFNGLAESNPVFKRFVSEFGLEIA
ncbi:MAG: DNA polymerase III subunit gamma/tau [Prevotellaceae bacterium]|jgi:DNA polymerase-3 subunit gamma/tau|nr:DNA polymerase III subunit gamma/tau [Prevotellaceae bacterium]